MNGNTASNSIIGGADGPTAIFLAGKLGDGFKTGIVIFVIAMLLLAAVMVLWKPGVKTKYRFIRLSAGESADSPYGRTCDLCKYAGFGKRGKYSGEQIRIWMGRAVYGKSAGLSGDCADGVEL